MEGPDGPRGTRKPQEVAPAAARQTQPWVVTGFQADRPVICAGWADRRLRTGSARPGAVLGGAILTCANSGASGARTHDLKVRQVGACRVSRHRYTRCLADTFMTLRLAYGGPPGANWRRKGSTSPQDPDRGSRGSAELPAVFVVIIDSRRCRLRNVRCLARTVDHPGCVDVQRDRWAHQALHLASFRPREQWLRESQTCPSPVETSGRSTDQ